MPGGLRLEEAARRREYRESLAGKMAVNPHTE
jgi:hypothetical protein